MTTRKLAMAGALGLASLGLIGAGAGATFTDAVNVQQKITAGTIDVQLTSSDNTVNFSQDHKTAMFQNLGPTNSSFTSHEVPTVITNHGTVQADAIWLSASDANGGDGASKALRDQLCVRIVSPIGGQEAYKGTLAYLEAHPVQIQGGIAGNGGTDSFTTEFYAGSQGCDSLTNAAMGGTVTPKITVSYQG